MHHDRRRGSHDPRITASSSRLDPVPLRRSRSVEALGQHRRDRHVDPVGRRRRRGGASRGRRTIGAARPCKRPAGRTTSRTSAIGRIGRNPAMAWQRLVGAPARGRRRRHSPRSRWRVVDLALWDLQATRAREHAGIVDSSAERQRVRVRVYGSGVNLHYTPRRTASPRRERWVDGRPHGREDQGRQARHRAKTWTASARFASVLGPDREAHDRRQPALGPRPPRSRIRRGAQPVRSRLDRGAPARRRPRRRTPSSRDASTCRSPSARTCTTRYRFRRFHPRRAPCRSSSPTSCASAASHRCRRIVALAGRAWRQRCMPHLLPELSGQLALTLPDDVASPGAEDVEDAVVRAAWAPWRTRRPSRSATAAMTLAETQHAASASASLTTVGSDRATGLIHRPRPPNSSQTDRPVTGGCGCCASRRRLPPTARARRLAARRRRRARRRT